VLIIGSAGFTGIYFVSDENVYTLASSYSPVGSQGNYRYDLDLASMKDLVQEAHDLEASASSIITHEKESLAVYAVRADISFKLDANNAQTLAPEFYPQLYLVRGVSVSQWDPLLQKEFALSVSSFFIRAASMVFTCWMLYHPIRKFISQLDASVVKVYRDKHKKKPKSSSSDNIVFKMFRGFEPNRSSHKSSMGSSHQVATRVEVVPQYTS
jgi:hypothetical protein